MVEGFRGEPSTLWREAASCDAAALGHLKQRHVRLTLEQIDIGFAGRRPAGDAVHAAIAALQPGAPLSLVDRQLLDARGCPVGRLAGGFDLKGDQVLEARVAGIVVRDRDVTPPSYRDTVRCDRWEVVVPDLVIAPGR